MKKLLIALFLLLTVAAFAIESAPSAVVGYVKYDCVQGLNLVSLPMNAGYAYASDLANAFPSKMDQISYWDAATQSWVTAVDLGGFWDGDFEVANGSVLWVNGLESFSLYSMGSTFASAPSYSLVAGLNTVMVPIDMATADYAGTVGTSIGADQVSMWDPATQSWVTAVDLGGFWDGDFAVSAGFPLWVNSLAETTWPAPAKSTKTINNTNRVSK